MYSLLTCRLTISQVLYLRDGSGLSMTADPMHPRGMHETASLLPRQHIRLLLLSMFYSDVVKATGYISVPWGVGGFAHWCKKTTPQGQGTDSTINSMAVGTDA